MKTFFCMAAFFTACSAAPYQDLVPRYDRLSSNVMARTIEQPTLANLDYAAYNANPILADRDRPKHTRPSGKIPLDSMTFGCRISEVKDRLEQTPLTPAEKEAPLAWRPLVKRLWAVVKERRFQAIGSAINSWKWADTSVFQPYQELTAAFLHGSGDSMQVWVKVEFSPWVDFLSAVDDEDRDGIKEIYGRLNSDSIPRDSLGKASAWIRDDYSRRLLGRDEVVDWATDLASYWYPVKNTDVVDRGGSRTWPDSRTEAAVKKTMSGVVIGDPVAVIRGKPFDPRKPIYNVYVVKSDSSAPAAGTAEPMRQNAQQPALDTAVSKNFTENAERFQAELKRFGSYGAWKEKNAGFMDGLADYLGRLPPAQMAFAGKDRWLFFRKSCDYLLGGDLSTQAPDKNPVPHIAAFASFLRSRGVGMLFVAVPCKEEVYWEKLPSPVPPPAVSIVNPYGRKALADLQARNVEVIDLLPLFLAAKEEDAAAAEPLYQRHDTHWSDRGMEIAAEAIAGRIRDYSWYGSLTKEKYGVVDTLFGRLGDLVEKLPERERPSYEPAMLRLRQVRMPGGKPYTGTKGSPLMLVGDSFTGIFESVDCKSAGIGAHIAQKSGLGVEIITSWGGGPLVRKKAMQMRQKYLPEKKLVIYLMADRDLYNYQLGWEKFP